MTPEAFSAVLPNEVADVAGADVLSRCAASLRAAARPVRLAVVFGVDGYTHGYSAIHG